MKSIATFIAVIALFTSWATAQNTIQNGLTPKTEDVEVPTTEGAKKRSANDQMLLTFNPKAITIKGFTKKAADTRESFSVTNNSQYHISRIKIKLQYTDMYGVVLDEQTRLVDVDVKPGKTRKASIKSFDNQKTYYFYLTPARTTIAIPFKVSYSLERYDIVIE